MYIKFTLKLRCQIQIQIQYIIHYYTYIYIRLPRSVGVGACPDGVRQGYPSAFRRGIRGYPGVSGGIRDVAALGHLKNMWENKHCAQIGRGILWSCYALI